MSLLHGGGCLGSSSVWESVWKEEGCGVVVGPPSTLSISGGEVEVGGGLMRGERGVLDDDWG